MRKSPHSKALTPTEIELIDMAKHNLASIQAANDRPTALNDLFGRVDTVQAVYEDASHPTGIGVRFIHGEHHVRNFMDRDTPVPSRNSAIWVKSVEEAEAMRREFGDGRPKVDAA